MKLVVCGFRRFQIDPLGDHLCTCVIHSDVLKAHDWVVDQITDLFHTTHKVKTQQVVRSRGQRCGDIELAGYLTNETGPVSWYWTSVSSMTDSEVVLTLVLMDTYITRMM